MATEAAKRIHKGLSDQRSKALLKAMARVQLNRANPDLYALLVIKLTFIERKLDFVLSEMKASNEARANDNLASDDAASDASKRKGLLIIGGLLLAAVLLL
jgi:hypothetical protein